MTPQEIFDTVCDHLATQKKRASKASGGCYYRTEDGLKCAVGCLIPDALYDVRMDGCFEDSDADSYNGTFIQVADGIRAGIYSKELEWMLDHEALLSDLQTVHDDAVNWVNRHDMNRSLRRVARLHELDYSKVEPTIEAIFT